MKSIREVYKIGRGPSSSHTIGPERACKHFLEKSPEANAFKVVLYGSLAKTGTGHGTDRVIRETLSPAPVEIIFSEEEWPDMHPNTMDLIALKGTDELKKIRVESIGGGNIRIEGEDALRSPSVYPENSMAEIIQFCKWRYISIPEYVELNEGAEIWDFLIMIWKHMQQEVNEGLLRTGILPGGLNVERKAKLLYESISKKDAEEVVQLKAVCAFAYAAAEQNADNGTVVTAPTCGACGVLPAVLLYMQRRYNYSDEEMAKALATAGLVGNLVRRNASISGAECGCQAEVGTATSMAAAAMCQLLDYPIEEIEYAAEVAMEHSLGLTCDPICGLVQIPCIERNAVAATRAMDSCQLAHILAGTRNVSFDMVVRTMKETGMSMSYAFRETAEGGLAKYYTRHGKK